MQKLKQTLILSGNSNEMATLTLEKNGNGVFGTIKVFNLNDKDDLIVGVSSNNSSVYKQNVVFNKGNLYTFKLSHDVDFDDVGCVIVRKVNDTFVPVLWGKKHNYKDQILKEFNDTYVPKVNVNNVNQTTTKVAEKIVLNKDIVNNSNSHLFETSDDEVESLINAELIDQNLSESNDDNTFADDKNYILEPNDDDKNIVGISATEKDFFKEENDKLKETGDNDRFFELISEQIDDLFDNYPRVDELEALIDNSKWVKIDFEDNGNEYVLGLIYEGFDLKYICYGVPGKFNSQPPKQLGECQWLPLDAKNPSDGYFIIYQDAVTGDKVNIV